MDFSYNYLTRDETLAFQNALAGNHTLFGFHFDGHQAKVNEKGHIELTTGEASENELYAKGLCINVSNYERIKGRTNLDSYPIIFFFFFLA